MANELTDGSEQRRLAQDLVKTMSDHSKALMEFTKIIGSGGGGGAAGGGLFSGMAMPNSVLGMTGAVAAYSALNAAGQHSLNSSMRQVAAQIGHRDPGAGAAAAAQIGSNDAESFATSFLSPVPWAGKWAAGKAAERKENEGYGTMAVGVAASADFYNSQKVGQYDIKQQLIDQSISLDWNQTPQERQYNIGMHRVEQQRKVAEDVSGARVAAFNKDKQLKARMAEVTGAERDTLAKSIANNQKVIDVLQSDAMQEMMDQSRKNANVMEKNAETEYMQETFGRAAPQEQISPWQRARAPQNGLPKTDARVTAGRGEPIPGGLFESIGRTIYGHETGNEPPKTTWGLFDRIMGTTDMNTQKWWR